MCFYYATELLLYVKNTEFFNKINMCFYYATQLLLYVSSTDFFNRNNMCFYHATELLLYVNNTDFFNKNNLRFYYAVIFQIIFQHELNRFGLKACHFFLYKVGGLTVSQLAHALTVLLLVFFRFQKSKEFVRFY